MNEVLETVAEPTVAEPTVAEPTVAEATAEAVAEPTVAEATAEAVAEAEPEAVAEAVAEAEPEAVAEAVAEPVAVAEPTEAITKNDDGIIVIKKVKKKRKRKQKKTKNLDLADKALSGLYSAVRDVISHLIIRKGNWVGINIMRLVKEVIELAEGYKHISGKEKKNLVMLVLKEIFTNEIAEADLSANIKGLIMGGIELVIEPALEMAVYAAKGNIKINKQKLLGILLSCFKR